ncbi:hypothetical protein KEM52_001054 [Ascosphaera acerosa]|nr:hypothetical protein KEM52_001054 [Ascosphaera acerosa]
MTTLRDILQHAGELVEDAEQEAAEIFCEELPPGNLGFIDPHAHKVTLAVAGRDFELKQAPTVLVSERDGGTTGAVLWKITPKVAEWLSDTTNFLWRHSVLGAESLVVELGCGVSGLIPLTLAPLVRHCLVTDQVYVRKALRENLVNNVSNQGNQQRRDKAPQQAARGRQVGEDTIDNITFTPLDWELNHPGDLQQILVTQNCASGSSSDRGFDLLVACDTIYSEALVPSFVQTCAEICRLRPSLEDHEADASAEATSPGRPTVCVIAQHLRSLEVFETWCRESLKHFHVWRLRDEETAGRLALGTGSIVHLLVRKSGASSPT